MKRIKLQILGLVFSTFLLNAQTDFRPGYIIFNNGDTLSGEIDYRGDILMSTLCKFKNVDGTIVEYTPNDLKAFRFTDGKYFVAMEAKNRKVFLEFLIKGKLNIYYLRDENGDHYFLDKDGIKLTEIPYEEGTKYVDDKQVFYTTKKHIGILSYHMNDAPQFQSRIQAFKKPNHQNLIKLAEDYHNAVCKDEKCVVYKKNVPLLKISVNPFVGLVKYSGFENFSPEVGGLIYLWAPRTSEKIYFVTGFVRHNVVGKGQE